MNIVTHLRYRLANTALSKMAASRPGEHKPIPLAEASFIGIIYDWSRDGSLSITKLLQQAPLLGKKVSVLAYKPYRPAKAEPAAENCFSVKETNFLFQPKAEEVSRFMEKKFDVLIDLSTRDYYPILFILAQSRAGLNVSIYSEKKKIVSDLMIQLPETTEPAELFKQMNYYINQLNSK